LSKINLCVILIKNGGMNISMKDVPEEMKDYMLALIDSFSKCEWEKFDKALAGLTKSREEHVFKHA